jgi:Na+/melibiose symporter-like transporter
MAQLVGATLIMTVVTILIRVLFKPSKKAWNWIIVGWVLIAFGLAIINNIK